MTRGRHRYRQDSATSWLLAYIVGGLHLCVSLTYAVTA